MQESREKDKQNDPPRRLFRPQFSLRTIVIITSLAAMILAVNFWPPRITGEYYHKESYYFQAQRGWPFLHLDALSQRISRGQGTPRNSNGWPLGIPAPPRVTNWYKLAANILVQSAMVASVCWFIKWSWDMCGAINCLRSSANRTSIRNVLILTMALSFVGMMAIVWGITMTKRVTFDVADFLLTWGFVHHIPGWGLKRLLLPPLFIASGLLSLAAARSWLQPDGRRFKVTAVAVVTIIVLMAIDGIGRSLVDRFIFDMVTIR